MFTFVFTHSCYCLSHYLYTNKLTHTRTHSHSHLHKFTQLIRVQSVTKHRKLNESKILIKNDFDFIKLIKTTGMLNVDVFSI